MLGVEGSAFRVSIRRPSRCCQRLSNAVLWLARAALQSHKCRTHSRRDYLSTSSPACHYSDEPTCLLTHACTLVFTYLHTYAHACLPWSLHTYMHACEHADRQTDSQAGRQADRQRDRPRDRQRTDGQTDRQTDRHKAGIHTHTCKCMCVQIIHTHKTYVHACAHTHTHLDTGSSGDTNAERLRIQTARRADRQKDWADRLINGNAHTQRDSHVPTEIKRIHTQGHACANTSSCRSNGSQLSVSLSRCVCFHLSLPTTCC